jgi:cyanophycin synthetase
MTNNQTHIAKISSCSACGTAPVNHKFFYYESIVDSILNTLSKTLFGWAKMKGEGPITDIFMSGLIGFFKLIGLAKYSDDITLVASGRSELIWLEANRRNIKMQQIIMFGNPLEQYRAKINNRWVYFQSIPIPPWLPQGGYEWLDDKFILTEKLNASGIRAPHAKSVSSFRQAKKAFAELTKPVIIKPRSGSRGRHTTTNITTEAELKNAYDIGKQIAYSLVVEEHLFGSVYRATVINNKLVGFFRTSPPNVTGDGIHSINELIELKNKNKPEGISDIVINEDVTSFIARKNYTLESILPKDEILDVTAKTGRFCGGYTKEMFPEIHPKFHEIFAKAGKVVQASIVGFDLIIGDPTSDPDTQVWGVIECNSMPYIDLHYYAYEGTPLDLSKNVWDLWETRPKK